MESAQTGAEKCIRRLCVEWRRATVDKGNKFLITNQNKQPTIRNQFNQAVNEAAAGHRSAASAPSEHLWLFQCYKTPSGGLIRLNDQ